MGSVQMKTARSMHRDPAQVAEDLVAQLGSFRPKLVTLFAERKRDQRALNQALRERLPSGTRLLGATSNGEIDNSGMHEGSVVLGALAGDFEVGIGLGRDLRRDAMKAGSQAVRHACDELGVRQTELDPKRYLGLVIDDGFQNKKEELLLGVLEKNQSLVLVGGGAADSSMDGSAELHVDGQVTSDAALVAVFHTTAPWAALRSHAYTPTGRSLTITKVDDSGYLALEIDGKPAAARYAELLGVAPHELGFGNPNGFATYPTGLRVGHEYFMRSPFQPLPDGSIQFVNLLAEDTELEIMKLGDTAQHTQRFFTEELPRKVRDPSALLLFQCGARAMLSAYACTLEQLSQSFTHAPPCAGLNCMFEIYCGFHINTTLTVLAFGSAPDALASDP